MNPISTCSALLLGAASAIADPVSITADYSYDTDGRLVAVDYGSRGRVAYQPDRVGNLVEVRVTRPDALQLYDAWALATYGATNPLRNPDQDADGDGTKNLAEYAGITGPVETGQIQDPGLPPQNLFLRIPTIPTDPALKITFQGTDDLQQWEDLGTVKTSNGLIVLTPSMPGVELIEVQQIGADAFYRLTDYKKPPQNAKRFLRVVVAIQ